MLSVDQMPRWYLDRSVSLPPALGTDYLGLLREAKYTSGFMPAIDMVEMTKNDGEGALDRDLDIMCRAFGDLRNVVKSIHGVLPDYADSGILIKGNELFVAQSANRHSASAGPVFRPGRSRARYDTPLVSRSTTRYNVEGCSGEVAAPSPGHLWQARKQARQFPA
ncbi:hypothetical protein BKA63DRAFT_154554 [Paraphoma chrysanthemicola]|nr:hypothetical protein BKA63DRAFT_154554 [Paraphoma chrysanthemicola]